MTVTGLILTKLKQASQISYGTSVPNCVIIRQRLEAAVFRTLGVFLHRKHF
jgi:hypothetical protein